MNIRLKAAFDTLLFVIYFLAGVFGTYWILNTFETTGFYIMGTVFTAYVLYIVYSINLVRREYKEIK
jgi:hypothetical protein